MEQDSETFDYNLTVEDRDEAEEMIDSLKDVIDYVVEQGDMQPKVHVFLSQMIHDAIKYIEKQCDNGGTFER